ncbi:MAG: TonB-dependent receptor [Gemmatimonadaceae bacterium]|nr:TonB-dependent receptor [Gemmatimonadaceae bacterium]
MNLSRLRAYLGAAAALLFLTASASFAQVTTGAVAGRVTDASGAPLEGAQVQVRQVSTGVSRGAMTNADGRYRVPGLEVGSGYAVTVRRIGYTPVTRENVNVSIGQVARVDVQLSQAATTLAAVTVSTEIDPVIAPSKSGTGTTVSDSALVRLPSLGRNFTDFVALTPQVSNSGPGLSGGGSNNRYNSIQIDGSTESDMFGLGSTGQPGGQARGKSIGLESVKQYQVLLSPYDVRYGNFAGALINAVTKSGTNDWKGSMYWFFRDQEITRAQPYLSDFRQTQTGFSLGGPIIKDKIHFFVNPEFQSQKAPASGPYIGYAGATNMPTVADLDRFNAIASQWGLPTSSGGPRMNENPLTNIFARFDIQGLPFNSSLVVRHNYGKAQDDVFSRSFTGTTFQLLNNAYAFKSDKGASVIQLRSAFANGWYNEVFAGLTRIRDRRKPEVGGVPQFQAKSTTGFDIVSGAERFSHGNELDQDILELTDNLQIPVGTHRFTVGATYSTYKVRNLFAQSIFGVWNFNSLDDFQTGKTNQYIIGVPLPAGTDGAVRFNASLFGLYLQDEFNLTPRLAITAGVRADIPQFGDKPPTNPTIVTQFGRNTADIPTGNMTISPRLGFNWDATGDQKNQVRGGVGVFAGRPAYVWLSNSFQNSGLSGVALLTCNNTAAPAMTAANIANPPQTCATGTGASLSATAEVDMLSKDLKFPQNLRANIGYDRVIVDGIVATFEAMYTKGLNTLFYQNIALADPLGTDPHGRMMYGTAPLATNLKYAGRTTVLDVSNQNKDYSYQLTAGLQRRWRNNWEGSIFYTYSKAEDVQSLSSSTAFSQYRYGNPMGYNRQETVKLRPSLFEQPHRIVASGSYTVQKSGTDLSLIYVGESGQPFHYIYGGSSSGDLNGDGIGNDLMYIPKDVNDQNEIIFVQSGANTPAAQAAAFDKFIKNNSCLNDQRGKIMAPHSCREPFHTYVNFTLRQSLGKMGLSNALHAPALNGVTVQLDIFNLANFLNKDWGKWRSTGYGAVTGLGYSTKETGSMVGAAGVAARPKFTWNPSYTMFTENNINSNYRMQLSVRYAF